MAVLRISTTLHLPDDYVTQPAAILAMRGAGKSNTAVAIAEEMYAAGLPWVAIDPKGDWWGIRSSANGKGPGLPIPVFGGMHGDVPLEPGSGAFLADTIVELNLTCVLDVSDFASKAQQATFLTDFANRLFRLHGRSPQARHLFLEEADEYIPQKGGPALAPCIGAWTKIVKQGRSRGIGITIISQRSAVVSKDALTQVETLIAMRVTSPHDRKAIEGWVEYMSLSKTLVDSLPTLADGAAWVISPHWLAKTVKVQFRQRHTFDSGATPTHGKIRVPGTIADIDVFKLRELMKATIEKSEAEDPKLLQMKLRASLRERDTLQRLLDEETAAHTKTVTEKVEVRVEVPFVPPEITTMFPRLEGWLAELRATIDRMEERVKIGEAAIPDLTTEPVPQPARPTVDLRPERHRAGPRPEAAQVTAPVRHDRSERGARVVELGDLEVRLDLASRRALQVLAQNRDGLTWQQICSLTGYSVKASTIPNALTALRKAEYVTRTDPIRLTPEGVAAAGPVEALPTGPELVEFWMEKTDVRGRRMLDQAARAVFRELIRLGRESSLEELCDLTGYSFGASTVPNAMTALRKLGLVDGWALQQDFAAAIA